MYNVQCTQCTVYTYQSAISLLWREEVHSQPTEHPPLQENIPQLWDNYMFTCLHVHLHVHAGVQIYQRYMYIHLHVHHSMAVLCIEGLLWSMYVHVHVHGMCTKYTGDILHVYTYTLVFVQKCIQVCNSWEQMYTVHCTNIWSLKCGNPLWGGQSGS